jgi:uncharacterized protein (TIGR00255 family)
MTGYAIAQRNALPGSATPRSRMGSALALGLELRSVNSRFLDLTFRLPDELRAHEAALRDMLIAKLRRGKVEVRAAIEHATSQAVPVPSAGLLERLRQVQDTVRQCLPEARALGVADVLRMTQTEPPQTSELGQELLVLAAQALQELLDEREREGAKLAAMLQGHLVQLRELAQRALPLLPQLVEQQRSRFLDRWKEAMGLASESAPTLAAQERALNEATAFAMRIDVAEEITRLRSHLDEIERLLARGGEIGKRLDFLIQELHREANTLGSKSAALELTHLGLEMKVLVEQMREQVQNIE